MAEYVSYDMATSNQYVLYRIVVTLNSQDVANNTSNINVKVQAWRNNSYKPGTYGTGICHCYIHGVWHEVSISPSQMISENSYTQLFNGDATIGHAADGTLTLDVAAYFDIPTIVSSGCQSYYPVLPTIPRASQPTLSKTNFNIGEPITLYTNRASASFTHQVFFRHADGLYYGSIFSGIHDSCTWDTRMIYDHCKNSRQYSADLLLRTWHGGTLVGDKYVNFTANVVNSNPILGNISYVQTDGKVRELTGNNKDIILGKSSIKVTFEGAAANNSASIKKYCLWLGDKRFDNVKNEIEVTDIPLMVKTGDKMSGYVVDSRDYASNDVTPTFGVVYDYAVPSITNFTLKRENDIGSTVVMNFKYTVAEIIERNKAYSIEWRFKESGSSSWAPPVAVVNHGSTLEGFVYNEIIGTDFAIDKNYDFEIVVDDGFGKYTYTGFLQTAKPELSIRDNMIGINCVPTSGKGMLQIDGNNFLNLVYPIGSIYMSVNPKNPKELFGGEWEEWGKGRVPVGVDTAQTEFNEVEKLGGNKYLQEHSHGFMPNYNSNGGREFTVPSDSGAGTSGICRDESSWGNYPGKAHWSAQTWGTQNTGRGNGENMPPYITCYMWKRIH